MEKGLVSHTGSLFVVWDCYSCPLCLLLFRTLVFRLKSTSTIGQYTSWKNDSRLCVRLCCFPRRVLKQATTTLPSEHFSNRGILCSKLLSLITLLDLDSTPKWWAFWQKWQKAEMWCCSTEKMESPLTQARFFWLFIDTVRIPKSPSFLTTTASS